MKIDVEKFLFLYQSEYGPLKERQQNGLSFLLGKIGADSDIVDPRHAAYMLATTKHECAGTWQPIAEYGRGIGKKYGKPDKRTGKAYFGRGYVQLTWADNYQAMGQALKVSLLEKPELAMDPEIAWEIMKRGMMRGSFTGVKLCQFINEDRCDYVNARKIVNGLDCAEKIAGYAETIEGMLKNSMVEATV